MDERYYELENIEGEKERIYLLFGVVVFRFRYVLELLEGIVKM